MCLNSAFKLVDQAVVVDTGSTDKTIAILQTFGDRVAIKYFPWNQDFAAARNFSLEDIDSDWILILDADEKLVCDARKLRDKLAASRANGYDMVEEGHMGGGAKAKALTYARLFRNQGYRYQRAIHEQSNIDRSTVESLPESLGKIIHYGYLDQNMKEKDKLNRNLKILLAELNKNPQDAFLQYNVGATYTAKGDYERSFPYYFKCLELSQGKNLEVYHFHLFKKVALNYFLLDKFEECINFLDQISIHKGCAGFVDLPFIKGLCLKHLQRYDEAVRFFQQCLKMGDTSQFPTVCGRGSFLAKLELARIYQQIGPRDLAVRTYEEVVTDARNVHQEGLAEFQEYVRQSAR